MMELKPCPFCGNDKIKVKSRYVRDYSVVRVSRFQAHCTRCHSRGAPITGGYRYSWIVGVPDWVSKYVKIKEKEALEQEAIEAWNRRVNDGTERKTDMVIDGYCSYGKRKGGDDW